MYDIKKTQLEIAKEELALIGAIGETGIENLIISVQQGYDRFWYNEKVTPQEFCDLMGNQAYKLFQDHRDAQDFIKSKRPDYVELTIPENYEVTFNQDGTVTIN